MAAPRLERLDHLVLTVRNIEASCDFYEKVLGMARRSFGEGRIALHFGQQKINLHPYPSPVDLVASTAEPGTADLCFITDTPIAEVAAHWRCCGVAIIGGPVERTGAQGALNSLYCRDPDGNLIEVANERC